MFERASNKYYYQTISMTKHLIQIAPLDLFALFAIGLAIYRGFDIYIIVISLLFGTFVNISWIRKLKVENSNPEFETNGDGVSRLMGEANKLQSWGSVQEIQHIAPDDVKDKKPGFNIVFNDKESWFVSQRIEGYEQFYSEFKTKHIHGTNRKLVLYDRLNQYGKSID